MPTKDTKKWTIVYFGYGKNRHRSKTIDKYGYILSRSITIAFALSLLTVA